MVYASVEHPPVLGGKVKSYDDKEALKVRGVHQTVPIDPFQQAPGFQPVGGIAVIADNTWAAFQGRKKLNISWDNGPNETFNSDEYKNELRATSHNPCKVVRNIGDADAVFVKGGKVYEGDYYVPLMAHASMEPLVALAEFKDGKATLWAPTQNPQAVQDIVSKELGISKEGVICHVTLLGGGFGRKSKPDYVAEAAVLSKKVGRPVKVVWTREDDIKFDYYNAVASMYMKAPLGANGKPTAWLQRSVFPPIPSIFDVNTVYGEPAHLQQGWTDIPYDLPNLRIENGPAKAHVRIAWLRSVANIYHAFAIHPWETGRLRRVTEMVAEKSGWGKRNHGKGTGIGIAAHRSFLTYVATVVEVEVDDQGEVRIPRVDTVLDAGLVVNPEATSSPVRRRRGIRHKYCAKRRDYGDQGRHRPIEFSGLSGGSDCRGALSDECIHRRW